MVRVILCIILVLYDDRNLKITTIRNISIYWTFNEQTYRTWNANQFILTSNVHIKISNFSRCMIYESYFKNDFNYSIASSITNIKEDFLFCIYHHANNALNIEPFLSSNHYKNKTHDVERNCESFHYYIRPQMLYLLHVTCTHELVNTPNWRRYWYSVQSNTCMSTCDYFLLF